MSANDKQDAANDGMTRKQRRSAERAARKSSSARSSHSGSGRNSSSILLISLAAIIVGVIAVVALVLISGGLGGDDEIGQPDVPAPAAELHQGRTLVAADAVDPVIVEVFEDVQCPHCQTFTERVEPLLISKYVSDGTASLTYRDYIVFGDKSVDAAVAMRAADELDGAFWDYHHVLFHNAAGGSFSRTWLADIAESIGLDRDAFSDLLNDDGLRAGVEQDMLLGAGYTVGSTPSVVIDGELLEGASWELIDQAIEAAAAG